MDKAIRTLIVDDSKTSRKQMELSLKHLGLTRVHSCNDGPEALIQLGEAVLAGDPFGLVFCDWNMPEMDGIEVLRRIRDHEEARISGVKFIMVTGKAEKVRMAMDEGATTYVSKPLKEEKISQKLRFAFL